MKFYNWFWLAFSVVMIVVGCPKDDPISTTTSVDSTQIEDSTCLPENKCYGEPKPPRPPKDEI
jgi:hypothetical protein